MDTLADYFVREILKIRKRPYQGSERLFFDRIRRKLNEGQMMHQEENNKLKELYERASDSRRIKW